MTEEVAEAKKGVFVVDDEPLVRRLVQRILQRAEIQVWCASDGIEALEMFPEIRARVGVVVLDMSMPEMDGVEVMERLREMEPTLPVILSSGYDRSTLGKIPEQDITSFVRKPYRPDDLLAVVIPFV
ncbi:MAG: response regulator [Myxococcota bacterium]